FGERHPERFVGQDSGMALAETPAIRDIISTKRHWILAPQTPQNAYERHVAITAANEALQPFVAERRRAIKSRCHELQQHKRANAILQSREYSFCLFPQRHFETLLDK
ncbi:MAG: hypothetical protein L0228_13000, partial [Planctomycetes bacterium]|nr:hypothetical protein [Planctomycetota bacterium]